MRQKPSHLRSRCVASRSCFTGCGCYRTRGLKRGFQGVEVNVVERETQRIQILKHKHLSWMMKSKNSNNGWGLDCLILFLCMPTLSSREWSLQHAMVSGKRSFFQILSHSWVCWKSEGFGSSPDILTWGSNSFDGNWRLASKLEKTVINPS